MQLAVLAMFLLVPCCTAQITAKGRCPTVQVKQDFVLSKYLGKWYEIQRFPTVFQQKATRCVRAIYTQKDGGHVKVDNKGYDEDNNPDGIVGDAYTPDPTNPAKLAVRFFETRRPGSYWILDTDYDNYSLVFSCKELRLGVAHLEFLWILSRNRTLPKDTVDRLTNLAKSYGLKVHEFTVTDQTNCPTN